jgi:iron complex transport system substrate-binding protein
MAQADSIYESVSQAYKALTTSQIGERSIMSGMAFRGTWYMPSGNTFMGKLFRDAGANYRYANHQSTASLPLSVEQVLHDFADADVWVGCDALTLDEVASIDVKHTWFRAYQTGNVYHFRKRTLPSGANDFWESGVVHPERILQDLRNILQGDTSQLYYAAPLK